MITVCILVKKKCDLEKGEAVATDRDDCICLTNIFDKIQIKIQHYCEFCSEIEINDNEMRNFLKNNQSIFASFRYVTQFGQLTYELLGLEREPHSWICQAPPPPPPGGWGGGGGGCAQNSAARHEGR